MRTRIDKEPLVGLLGGILPFAPCFQCSPGRTKSAGRRWSSLLGFVISTNGPMYPSQSPRLNRSGAGRRGRVFGRLALSSSPGLPFTRCISRVTLEGGAVRSRLLQPPRLAASFSCAASLSLGCLLLTPLKSSVSDWHLHFSHRVSVWDGRFNFLVAPAQAALAVPTL